MHWDWAEMSKEKGFFYLFWSPCSSSGCPYTFLLRGTAFCFLRQMNCVCVSFCCLDCRSQQSPAEPGGGAGSRAHLSGHEYCCISLLQLLLTDKTLRMQRLKQLPAGFKKPMHYTLQNITRWVGSSQTPDFSECCHGLCIQPARSVNPSPHPTCQLQFTFASSTEFVFHSLLVACCFFSHLKSFSLKITWALFQVQVELWAWNTNQGWHNLALYFI